MKTFFVDVETTGTDPEKHGLIQMSGKIFEDDRLQETVDYFMSPFPDDLIEDQALSVNGKTREQILDYTVPRAVHQDFIEKIEGIVLRYDRTDKMHLVGYNADFDAGFIRKWFEKCGDLYFGSYFWWPVIDVAKLAAVRLMRSRHELPNFKLMTVARHFDINVEDGQAHDAMFDIRVTMRLFKILTRDLGLFDFAAKPSYPHPDPADSDQMQENRQAMADSSIVEDTTK